MNALSSEGIEFRIEGVVNIHEARGVLTAKQEALLMTALREGYFDTPRGTDSHRLAKELGLSPRALSVRLRRAVKRILKEYLVERPALSQKTTTY